MYSETLNNSRKSTETLNIDPYAPEDQNSFRKITDKFPQFQLNNSSDIGPNKSRKYKIVEINEEYKYQRLNPNPTLQQLSSFINDLSEINTEISLIDFEKQINQFIDQNLIFNEYDSVQLIEMLKSYIKVSNNIYFGIPAGMSRCILTCIQILILIDKIATSSYPQLRSQTSLGFLPEHFIYLLVPKQKDLKSVKNAFDYLNNRNNSNFPILNSE